MQDILKVAPGVAQLFIRLLKQRVQPRVQRHGRLHRYRFGKRQEGAVACGIACRDGGGRVARAIHHKPLRRGLHRPHARRRVGAAQVVHRGHHAAHKPIGLQKRRQLVAAQQLGQQLCHPGVGLSQRGQGSVGRCQRIHRVLRPRRLGGGRGAAGAGGAATPGGGANAIATGRSQNHQAAPAATAHTSVTSTTQTAVEVRSGAGRNSAVS